MKKIKNNSWPHIWWKTLAIKSELALALRMEFHTH